MDFIKAIDELKEFINNKNIDSHHILLTPIRSVLRYIEELEDRLKEVSNYDENLIEHKNIIDNNNIQIEMLKDEVEFLRKLSINFISKKE